MDLLRAVNHLIVLIYKLQKYYTICKSAHKCAQTTKKG